MDALRANPQQDTHDDNLMVFNINGEEFATHEFRMYRFKAGTCAKGDNCAFAHGVFESWLHPSKYKTQELRSLSDGGLSKPPPARPIPCPSTGARAPSCGQNPVGDLSAIAAEVEKLLGEKAMLGMHKAGLPPFAPPPPPPPPPPTAGPSPHSALSSLLSSAKALQSTMPGVDIMHLVQGALTQDQRAGPTVQERSSVSGRYPGGHLRAPSPQRRQSFHAGTSFMPPPQMSRAPSMQAPPYRPPEQMRRCSWAGPPLPPSDFNTAAEPMRLRPAYSASGRHSAAPGGYSAPLPAFDGSALSPRSGALSALSAPFGRSDSAGSRRQSLGAPPPPPPPRHIFTAPTPGADAAPPDSSTIDWSHIPASAAEAASKHGNLTAARDMSGSGVSDLSCASMQMPFEYRLWAAREGRSSCASVFGDADATRSSSRQLDYAAMQTDLGLDQSAGVAPDGLRAHDIDTHSAPCSDPLLSALPQDLLYSMSYSAEKLNDVTNNVCGVA